MDAPFPKIRGVEAFPVEIDGRHLICLRDPLQYASESLLVPHPAFFILTLLDGAHSVLDIQEAWTQRFGSMLESAEIRALIATLEQHHYLDSEGFAAYADAVAATFHADPVRRPAHAGTSYPSEPDELRRHLGAFFTGITPLVVAGTLRGIVAPHIDLRVGGTGYGHAYAALAAAAPAAERFIILGTSHYGGRGLFNATRKDFATPLGTVATDRVFLERLARRTPEDLYTDELLHRVEHSVEFQVVLLQHVLGAERPFTVVPILVNSFHEMMLARRAPASDERVAGFVAALRATLAEDPRPTIVIAGVDFAHVGAKFGDDGLSQELVALTEAKDRRLITALERGDADGFFATVAADGDRTRICGLAPLYTFLAIMDGAAGHLLHYDRSRDEVTSSSVTYASLAYSGA
jgi:hypothetical protein